MHAKTFGIAATTSGSPAECKCRDAGRKADFFNAPDVAVDACPLVHGINTVQVQLIDEIVEQELTGDGMIFAGFLPLFLGAIVRHANEVVGIGTPTRI